MLHLNNKENTIKNGEISMMRIGVLFGLLLLNSYAYGLSPIQVRQLSTQATQAIAQNNFDAARTIIQQLKDAREGATARQLEANLTQAQSTQAAQQAKTTITQGQTDIDKLNAELKEKGSRLGQTIKERRTAEQQVYELTTQLESANKTITTLQQQTQDQQIALAQALDKKGQEALATLKNQYEKDKTDLANRLRIAEEKKQEALNESNKSKFDLDAIKTQLENATKDKEGLRTEYQKGLEQCKKEYTDELEKIKTGNVSDLNNKLNDITGKFQSCSTELDKVQKEQVTTLNKLDTTSRELERKKQDFSVLETQLKQAKAAQDAAIQAATKTLQAEKEKALQGFKDATAELNQKNRDLDKEKEALRAEYQKDLEQRQKEYARNLEDIKKGDITTLQKELNDKTQLHENCSKELTRVQQENGTLTEQTKVLKSQLDDLEHAKQSWQNQMNNLQAQVAKAKTDQETAVNAIKIKLNDSKHALTEAENQIKKFKNEKDIVEQQKNSMAQNNLIADAVNNLYRTPPNRRDYDLFEYIIKAIEAGIRGALDDNILKKAQELKKEADAKKAAEEARQPKIPEPGKPTLLPTQMIPGIPGAITTGKTK